MSSLFFSSAYREPFQPKSSEIPTYSERLAIASREIWSQKKSSPAQEIGTGVFVTAKMRACDQSGCESIAG